MSDIVSSVVFDRADKKIHFVRSQDCQPIVDAAKELEQIPQKGDFRHIATIPNILIEKALHEEGVNILALPKKELTRYLRGKLKRGGDWAYLRTAPAPPPYRAPR